MSKKTPTRQPYGLDPDYPSVPDPAALSLVDVADLADRFVRYVTEYIRNHDIELMAMSKIKRFDLRTPDGEKVVESALASQRETNEAAARIRRYGPALAIALGEQGFDPSGVLSIVHCAGAGGGGVLFVLPKWEERKVYLQATAIRLRTPKGKHEQPNDLITTAVAVRDFETSARNLRRMVKNGKLTDYRPADAPKNAIYRLSRAEVALKCGRRR